MDITAAAGPGTARAGGRQQSRHAAAASRRSLACQAVADPSILQEVIVGSAVATASVAALRIGFSQKEPQPCPACAGNGGTVCFACSGSGKSSAPLEAVAAQQQRDPLGGSSRSKRQCNVCKGCGRCLCRQCRGSGYV